MDSAAGRALGCRPHCPHSVTKTPAQAELGRGSLEDKLESRAGQPPGVYDCAKVIARHVSPFQAPDLQGEVETGFGRQVAKPRAGDEAASAGVPRPVTFPPGFWALM